MKSITIFEGPDGAGKSTAAKALAEATGARYAHFDAMPGVTKGLARMYVEAMTPALLGYQDLVFDRSWLSDVPYGTAFRGGMDRLGNASRRMLERLAMRCATVVVRCDPGWDAVIESFRRRKGQEMLETEAQLRQVYDLYTRMPTDLPPVFYNYLIDPTPTEKTLCWHRTMPHPSNLATAGNWNASRLLVGESFAERKDQDAFYQWPFASFSGQGCSQWLTDQLAKAGVGEDELLWVNADQDLSFIKVSPTHRQIIALGDKAADALDDADVGFFHKVPHPQSWKRFNFAKPYNPLLEILRP